MKVENFMSLLHSQAEVPKSDVDAKIMAKINRWRIKQTSSYINYKKIGGSDTGYLAHMFARAGVDKDAAKSYITNLHDAIGSMEDFENEYKNTKFEETFRDIAIK